MGVASVGNGSCIFCRLCMSQRRGVEIRLFSVHFFSSNVFTLKSTLGV